MENSADPGFTVCRMSLTFDKTCFKFKDLDFRYSLAGGVLK